MTTEAAKQSEFEDHRRPLLRAIRLGSYMLLGVGALSLMVWGAVAGLAGIWGVLLGASIGGGFVLLTAVSMLLAANTTPAITQAVVLGGWLLKVVVLIIVLALIQNLTFYHRWAFVVTTVIVLIAVLSMEMWGVITSRVTYVQPQASE